MSLEEEALQFGNPALWSSREGIWRRRGQEVLLEWFQSNYQRERQKCWSLFPLEPSPGLGRAIPPSTSSTSPTLSTIYSSRRPAWDGDGGWTELLLLISWYYYPFPPHPDPDLNKMLLFTNLLTSLTWRWRSPSSSSPWSPRDPCSTTVRRRLWKFF